MAISFTPIELGNLANEPTFLANLNANFSELETLLQDCVSRSGEAPNFWEADQDANSYRLYNLAELISTVVRCEELWINGVLFTGEGGSGGVTDHGQLTGLGDDDHTQYHNNTRGDLRYYLKSEVYTQAEITALLGAFQTYVDDSVAVNTDAILANTDLIRTTSRTISTASGVTISGDTENMVEMSNSSSNTLTVTNSAHAIYDKVHVMQIGTGQTTIALDSGTLRYPSGLSANLSEQWSVVTVWKRSASEWVLFGDLEAAS